MNALWQNYPVTYRANEVKTLARWILAGASGSLLGLPGSGRSNLLGFLCNRPDVLATNIDPQKLRVTLLLIDLNDLPTRTLNDLYRVILRTFHEAHSRFTEDVQKTIIQLYLDYRSLLDPFLTQSAVHELFLTLQATQQHVVLVIDGFDTFCRQLTPETAQALGSLRNRFRDTLSYIVGIRQSLKYLEDLEIGEDLYRLLTTHVCYLGSLNEQDAHSLIARRTIMSQTQPNKYEIQEMMELTGGYPTLLKAVCRWWLLESDPPPTEHWLSTLGAMPTIQHRLETIWLGLTQEEQLTMTELAKDKILVRGSQIPLQQRHRTVLEILKAKGLCRIQMEKWVVGSMLLTEYIAHVGGVSRGRIWLELSTNTLYHGQQVLNTLTPKETEILQYFVKYPNIRHTYTNVIVHVWSTEESYNGVSNDSLFQVVHGLRRKIEPDLLQPVYIVNWRGKPEGGYIFYAEGKPG